MREAIKIANDNSRPGSSAVSVVSIYEHRGHKSQVTPIVCQGYVINLAIKKGERLSPLDATMVHKALERELAIWSENNPHSVQRYKLFIANTVVDIIDKYGLGELVQFVDVFPHWDWYGIS